MAKMTSGILCQDSYSTSEPIVFFPGAKRRDVIGATSPYGWDRTGNVPEAGDCFMEWTLEKWCETYDLTPPAPGKCFEVSIEL